MTLHADYLDYSARHGHIADVDAAFWPIGIGLTEVDEDTDAQFHVDFPVWFVTEGLRVMWARQKQREERSLVELAKGSRIDVITCRPDYLGPDDQLVVDAKALAPQHGKLRLPVLKGRGGVAAGVDTLSNNAMLAALGDDP